MCDLYYNFTLYIMKNFIKNILNKIFVQKDTISLILFFSLLLLLGASSLFLWNREFFIWNGTIDEGLLGTLGDFIGGIIGSIWALIGVILFYLALKEQRKDIKTNQKALNKQIDALKVQTKEFGLQKVELRESRSVFKEQAKTLKKQQFESTFFSMLELYNFNVKNMIGNDGNIDFFENFANELTNNMVTTNEPFDNHKVAQKKYAELFYREKTKISHYFRIVYRIMRFIESSSMSEEEKISYSKIIRSQFSEKELLVLYYNSHSIFGRKFIPLALKYKIFKHLPEDSKIEFKDYFIDDVKTGFNRLIFIQNLKTLIYDLYHETNYNIENVIFPVSSSIENKDAGMFIRVEIISDDFTEIKVSFLNINNDLFDKFFGLNKQESSDYFIKQFHHLFIFSNYVDYESQDYNIKYSEDENNITYIITNTNRIDI